MSDKLYKNTNSDNILIRSVIAGLLDLLNNKVDYEQVWDDTVIEKVNVPWYYNFGASSERFMQDNYTSFGKECFNERMINGTFSPKPIGWITYGGSQIEASAITNRFVQGTYMRNKNGRLVPYVSFLYSMPITATFECKVEADNFVSALKIEQAIRETFYKNKTFFVLYRGMRIGCTAGFPEQLSIEKTTEYSFDSAQKSPIITFTVSVETYQPVFDKTTEMERDKTIRGFGLDVFVPYSKASKTEELKTLVLKDVDTSIGYPSGVPFYIGWEWTSKDSDFLPVQISYIADDCPCEEVILEHVLDNQSMYIWDIPEGFGGFVQPDIMFSPDATVIREPKIKIVPDKNGLITDKSFIVLDKGYIDYDMDDVPFTFEYADENGMPVIVDGYKFRLDNGRIDQDDPVVVDGSNIHKYKITPKCRKITLFVKYTKDTKVMAKIPNLLIY